MTHTTIWSGARIATVNPAQPWAEAFAVRDGVFIAVGSSAEVLELAGPDSTVHHLDGALVLPGFVESHVHILLGAAMSSGAQLQMTDSVEDILHTVRQFAEDHPERPAVFGASYNALLFDENGPSAAMLDQAVADRPVVLMDHTLHGAWANTKALELAGITAHSPDPLPSRYVRNPDGTPTGAIKGSGASQPVLEAVNAISADTVRAALPTVLAALTRFGFTAAMDCGNVLVTEPAFDAIEQLESDGHLPLRVSLTTMVNTPESARTAMERHDRLCSRFQSDRQWSDTLKVITDSVLENQTAATLEPYCSTHDHGSLYFSADTVRSLVGEVAERGHGVILHAIGDRAVRAGLDVAQDLRRTSVDTRFILTHCQLVAVGDRARFAEHDVIVQTTANWANYQPSYVEHLGAERNDTLQFPFRSWIDSGATLALGADWPATPGGIEYGMNPFVNIYTAMHRKVPPHLIDEFGSTDRVLGPAEEVLTLEEALYGYTMAGAKQLGRDARIGSIEVGKSADFIVLDQNLFEIDPERIPYTQVLATYLEGERCGDVSDD